MQKTSKGCLKSCAGVQQCDGQISWAVASGCHGLWLAGNGRVDCPTRGCEVGSNFQAFQIYQRFFQVFWLLWLSLHVAPVRISNMLFWKFRFLWQTAMLEAIGLTTPLRQGIFGEGRDPSFCGARWEEEAACWACLESNIWPIAGAARWRLGEDPAKPSIGQRTGGGDGNGYEIHSRPPKEACFQTLNMFSPLKRFVFWRGQGPFQHQLDSIFLFDHWKFVLEIFTWHLFLLSGVDAFWTSRMASKSRLTV